MNVIGLCLIILAPKIYLGCGENDPSVSKYDAVLVAISFEIFLKEIL